MWLVDLWNQNYVINLINGVIIMWWIGLWGKNYVMNFDLWSQNYVINLIYVAKIMWLIVMNCIVLSITEICYAFFCQDIFILSLCR